jgi:riboflavin kinase/FMN adenylyltransferase
MLIHQDLSSLPEFKNAVVTIGTFDGVHSGHQQIILQLKNEARKINGETVIITFHPHPRKIIHQGQSPVLILTTLSEKIELLEARGVDHLVVVPFNTIFSNQAPEEYVQNFLVQKFHPNTVIIGYDHRFGKERQGDYHLLEELGMQLGFKVREIPEHVLNEVIISSTRIREALLRSDIATANKFLGYDYFFEGTVLKGDQVGRTIGYPTANININDAEKLIPGNGVYAVEIEVRNQKPKIKSFLTGMMNIGVRPTVDGTKRMIEANIFDFDEDIYGKTLRVYVKHYLRGEIKFDGLDSLKLQLSKDKEAALEKIKAM